jgi:hypothetical protein
MSASLLYQQRSPARSISGRHLPQNSRAIGPLGTQGTPPTALSATPPLITATNSTPTMMSHNTDTDEKHRQYNSDNNAAESMNLTTSPTHSRHVSRGIHSTAGHGPTGSVSGSTAASRVSMFQPEPSQRQLELRRLFTFAKKSMYDVALQTLDELVSIKFTERPVYIFAEYATSVGHDDLQVNWANSKDVFFSAAHAIAMPVKFKRIHERLTVEHKATAKETADSELDQLAWLSRALEVRAKRHRHAEDMYFSKDPVRRQLMWREHLRHLLGEVDKDPFYTPNRFPSANRYDQWLWGASKDLHNSLIEVNRSISHQDRAAALTNKNTFVETLLCGLSLNCTRNHNDTILSPLDGMDGTESTDDIAFIRKLRGEEEDTFAAGLVDRKHKWKHGVLKFFLTGIEEDETELEKAIEEVKHAMHSAPSEDGKRKGLTAAESHHKVRPQTIYERPVTHPHRYARVLFALAEFEMNLGDVDTIASPREQLRRLDNSSSVLSLIRPMKQSVPIRAPSLRAQQVLDQYCGVYKIGPVWRELQALHILAMNINIDAGQLAYTQSTLRALDDLHNPPLPENKVPWTIEEIKHYKRLVLIFQEFSRQLCQHHRALFKEKPHVFSCVFDIWRMSWYARHELRIADAGNTLQRLGAIHENDVASTGMDADLDAKINDIDVALEAEDDDGLERVITPELRKKTEAAFAKEVTMVVQEAINKEYRMLTAISPDESLPDFQKASALHGKFSDTDQVLEAIIALKQELKQDAVHRGLFDGIMDDSFDFLATTVHAFLRLLWSEARLFVKEQAYLCEEQGEVDMSLFTIYHALRDFYSFCANLRPIPDMLVLQLSPTTLHTWFSPAVKLWLESNEPKIASLLESSTDLHAALAPFAEEFQSLPYSDADVTAFGNVVASALSTVASVELNVLMRYFDNEDKKGDRWGLENETNTAKLSVRLNVSIPTEIIQRASRLYNNRNRLDDLLAKLKNDLDQHLAAMNDEKLHTSDSAVSHLTFGAGAGAGASMVASPSQVVAALNADSKNIGDIDENLHSTVDSELGERSAASAIDRIPIRIADGMGVRLLKHLHENVIWKGDVTRAWEEKDVETALANVLPYVFAIFSHLQRHNVDEKLLIEVAKEILWDTYDALEVEVVNRPPPGVVFTSENNLTQQQAARVCFLVYLMRDALVEALDDKSKPNGGVVSAVQALNPLRESVGRRVENIAASIVLPTAKLISQFDSIKDSPYELQVERAMKDMSLTKKPKRLKYLVEVQRSHAEVIRTTRCVAPYLQRMELLSIFKFRGEQADDSTAKEFFQKYQEEYQKFRECEEEVSRKLAKQLGEKRSVTFQRSYRRRSKGFFSMFKDNTY